MDLLTIAIILFVCGVLLGIAEIFIPSAGILVVLSLSAFIGSIVCAFQKSPAWGITFVLAAPLVMLVAVVKGFKVFPKTPFGRRMILARPDAGEHERAADRGAFDEPLVPTDALVGREGVARADLRPAGWADIDGRRCQVVSVGDFIPVGSRIRVVETRGNIIVVEALGDPA